MSKRQKKGLDELKTRARLALDSPALVGIASSANSPSAAYSRAYLETGDVKASRSCQCLAAIKRDYGKKPFDDTVSSVVSNRPQPKAQGKSKGVWTMSTRAKIRKKPSKVGVAAPAEVKTPQLPLRQIEYRAAVVGLMAEVRCLQEYENDADHPVEAVYVFPLPEEASVTGCVMQIGKRRVQATLKKREEARQEYDAAVAAGHHGALLEQERSNIFTMNVGGIEPGEKITVQFDYVQRVAWQDSGGRFRVPLVVAPRFIPGEPTKKGSGWSPDTDQVPDASRITPKVAKQGVPYTASVKVSLSVGFRCLLESPSHSGCVGASATVAKAETREIKTGKIATDRDFILTYRSLSKVTEVALHSQQTADESFLLATVVPPLMATPVARDVVLLLDISGSMYGAKLAGLKVLVNKVLGKLREQDAGQRVAVIAFESQPHLIWPMGQITDELLGRIRQLDDRGGTELGPALTVAAQQFGDSGRPKFILLVTDGQTESMRYTMSGVRIIAAGIDTAVNDDSLKSLARRTGGTCLWFYPGEDFDRAANSLFGYLSGPVLTELKVTGGEAVGVQDVFQGQPAAIAVRLADKSEIVLHGKDASGADQEWRLKPTNASNCDFAAQVWAREFLREHQGQDEQVAVSLKYGVICRHTSFVAISQKEVPGQQPMRVEISVNLPHGWDYDKIFGRPATGVARHSLLSTACGAVSSGGRRFAASSHASGLGHSGGGRRMVTASVGSDFDGIRIGSLGAMDDDGALLCGSAGGPDDPDEFLPDIVPPDFTPDLDPQAQQAVVRFTLDAADPVDRLIGILIVADCGDFEAAEQVFKKLKLTLALVKSWTPEKRSMAGYFLWRLKAYGLSVSSDVLAICSATSTVEVGNLPYLIRKERGLSYSVQVIAGVDGAEYIRWKLGLDERPTAEPWSLVP